MTPEEYKWAINFVKDRYQDFEPTFEQAEKIYHVEQERDFYSREHYFSAWEELDYMLDNIEKIFTEKQLKKFLVWHNENIQRHEKYLIESDNDQLNYIDYHSELLKFYEQRYISDLFKEKHMTQRVALSFEKAKVEYLKSEYKMFLDTQKIGIISTHYRNSRRFQPITLKVSLLRHKINYTIPNYSYFKSGMDEPTQTVARYILDKFQNVNIHFEGYFKQKEEELRQLQHELRAKYIGEERGYSFTIKETEEQAIENKIMLVILLDLEKYGC